MSLFTIVHYKPPSYILRNCGKRNTKFYLMTTNVNISQYYLPFNWHGFVENTQYNFLIYIKPFNNINCTQVFSIVVMSKSVQPYKNK